MLHFLPSFLLGCLTVSLLIGNLLLWTGPVYTVIVAKVIVPVNPWRRRCTKILEHMAETWSKFNGYVISLTQKVNWDIEGLDNLEQKDWYLVNCNHQSALDILVIQQIFNQRIPFPKYFLKQELLWTPIFGFIWWALEYPFMKRFSKAYIEKHPEKAGKDLDTTIKVCKNYKNRHVSILNFLEGTRFTPQKHKQQSSPYRHLLRPKAGGIALALKALQKQVKSMLDVTIVYPDQCATLWKFLSGRISRIVVRVEKMSISPQLKEGDYLTDPNYRKQFQEWVHSLWSRKDELIDSLLHKNETTDQINFSLETLDKKDDMF